MDRTKFIVEDPSILSQDVLTLEYRNLAKHFDELKQSEDNLCQEVYTLRRELQTALNESKFLSAELDVINSDHSNEISELVKKHRSEIDSVKHQLLLLKEANESLEIERECLQNEIEELKPQTIKQCNNTVNVVNDKSHNESILKIEEQNQEYVEIIKDLQNQLADVLKAKIAYESHIADIEDRLHCSEENLRTKCDAINEINELYETAQERLIDLNGELNALRMQSDTVDKRGNSLFAEVDDQRKKMKAILSDQSVHFIEMKKELEKSQLEIRRLKREKSAMYKEMEVCTHIFMNADKHHTDKLNERIGEMIQEIKTVNNRLEITEESLRDMSKDKNTKWLDPMLEFCKNETKELKEKLFKCSLQKSEIADSLQKSQQEMARWRFEALKSRCIIAARETLLEENEIDFGEIKDINEKVRRINSVSATPIIGSTSQPIRSYKRLSFTNSTSNKKNCTQLMSNVKTVSCVMEKEEKNKIDSENNSDKNCNDEEKCSIEVISKNSTNNFPGILKSHVPNLMLLKTKQVQFNETAKEAVEKPRPVSKINFESNEQRSAVKKRVFIASRKALSEE